MTDESRERIERLETVVRALRAEVSAVRHELRAIRAVVAPGTVPPATDSSAAEAVPTSAPDPAATSAGTRPSAQPRPPQSLLGRILDPPGAGSPPPRPRPSRAPRPAPRPLIPSGMTFEDLVGRYGAMVLAALAIMSGVGIFLSWAIAQNLIGPTVRVGAGFAAAAALAALGWRLRNRNARTFGNTLMGIALAVVHVVAWGAGPGLQVMPNWLALGIAATASIALAALAWRSDEEVLFVVGVGGALIAPFVTTPTGRGNGEALLTFGWLVLTLALSGMRTRPWTIARRLLGTAGIAYASAAMTAAWSTTGTFSQDAPTMFAIACAWGALVSGGPLHAPGLVRAYLLGGLPPLFWNWDKDGVFPTHLVLSAIATLTLFFVICRDEEQGPNWVLWALFLPMAYLAGALVPLDDVTSMTGALVALGWATGAGIAGWIVPGARREVLWVVSALSLGVGIVLALSGREIETVIALSAYAAAVSWVMRREHAGMLLGPVVIALALGGFHLWIEFSTRTPFAYTPFLTKPSLGALAMVLGFAAVGWNTARTELGDGELPVRQRNALQGLGIIAAFLWGHVELSQAYAPDISVFLLIFYYAACGVTAIFVGRRSSLSDLRRVGLGLSVFAALKALVQGYELDTVGLRVGSFLLVGAFLLAVAYWYRSAGDVAPAPDARFGA